MFCIQLNAQNNFDLNLSYSNFYKQGTFYPIGLNINPSYRFANRWSVLTGFDIYYKRTSLESTIFTSSLAPNLVDTKQHFFIFSVPVMIKFDIIQTSRFTFYTKFGIRNNWERIYTHITNLNDGSDSWNTAKGQFSTYGSVGLGASYKICDKVNLFLESNAGYKLNGRNDNSYLDSRVGIIIPLGKR